MADLFKENSLDVVSQSVAAQQASLDAYDAMKETAKAREISKIEGQVFMAKRYPRDIAQVLTAVDASCSRLELASVAFYSYSRGGTPINGASIRLAETLAQCYHNLVSGTEVLSQDETGSLVRTYAWDIENNSQSERIFYVRHERDKTIYDQTTRKKVKIKEPLQDNRDIMEMINNIAARNRRACILELIPRDLTNRAMAQCQKTLDTNVQITPESLQSLVEAFKGFGVNKAQIEARIQCRLEAISVNRYLEMRSIFTAIKDGFGRPSDYFDESLVDSGSQKVTDETIAPKAGGKKSEEKTREKKGKEPHAAPDSSSEPADMATGPAENAYAEDDGLAGPEAYGDDDIDF